jgi:predicted small lipoprotein YifL
MRHEMKVATLAAALLMLAACGKGGPDADDAPKKKEADKDSGLELTAEQVAALGLTTARLEAVSYRVRLAGYGTTLAFDTIAQADADIATAEAAAAQSAAAAARAKELSGGDDAAVSRETWEVAAAKAATDQAAVLLARRKADVAFGLNAPWRNTAQRTAVLARLQSGRTVLVKVTFPPGASIDTKSFSITRVGDNGTGRETATVWEAPADAMIPGRSLFALVDGSDLASGERVIATLAVGAPQQGVRVPAIALVLGESDAWAYIKKDDDYVRIRIDTSHPDGDGYFASEGLQPDQEVVTGGAGLLYAREVNPSTKSDD